MGAGDSATAVAQRAEAKAISLRKKAEAAEQRAARFRAGAAGERVLDEAGQGLVDCGWFPLSDRCSPTGGNMDELFVGPAGVAVLDAKNWSWPVTVRNGQMRTGKYRQTRCLRRVLEQVGAVEEVLDRAGLGDVPVQGFIVLIGEPSRAFPPEDVEGVWVLGINFVRSSFSAQQNTLPMNLVVQAQAVIEAAFPPAG
jgi:Nuclease-related domain